MMLLKSRLATCAAVILIVVVSNVITAKQSWGVTSARMRDSVEQAGQAAVLLRDMRDRAADASDQAAEQASSSAMITSAIACAAVIVVFMIEPRRTDERRSGERV